MPEVEALFTQAQGDALLGVLSILCFGLGALLGERFGDF